VWVKISLRQGKNLLQKYVGGSDIIKKQKEKHYGKIKT
jgi:hypothetical protein